jgi:hypothetical protein
MKSSYQKFPYRDRKEGGADERFRQSADTFSRKSTVFTPTSPQQLDSADSPAMHIDELGSPGIEQVQRRLFIE